MASVVGTFWLQCGRGWGLPFASTFSVIMASNLVIATAMLVCITMSTSFATSALKVAASSRLNPVIMIVTGTETGVVVAGAGGLAFSNSTSAFNASFYFANVATSSMVVIGVRPLPLTDGYFGPIVIPIAGMRPDIRTPCQAPLKNHLKLPGMLDTKLPAAE